MFVFRTTRITIKLESYSGDGKYKSNSRWGKCSLRAEKKRRHIQNFLVLHIISMITAILSTICLATVEPLFLITSTFERDDDGSRGNHLKYLYGLTISVQELGWILALIGSIIFLRDRFSEYRIIMASLIGILLGFAIEIPIVFIQTWKASNVWVVILMSRFFIGFGSGAIQTAAFMYAYSRIPITMTDASSSWAVNMLLIHSSSFHNSRAWIGTLFGIYTYYMYICIYIRIICIYAHKISH